MIKENVKEYVEKLEDIRREMDLLKEDVRSLKLEYKDKLDVKAVDAALRVIKIKQNSDGNVIDDVIDILGVVDQEG